MGQKFINKVVTVLTIGQHPAPSSSHSLDLRSLNNLMLPHYILSISRFPTICQNVSYFTALH